MATPTARAVAAVLLAVLLLFAIGGCAQQNEPKPITLTEPAVQESAPQQDAADQSAVEQQAEEDTTEAGVGSGSDRTVYITRTGECHHADGCSSLSRSCFPIKLKDAEAKGYRPCQRCGGG